MRIVFIGTVEFSRRTLQHLIQRGVHIVGVCTTHASAFNADHSDLSGLCEANGIDWCYTDDVNSAATLNWIRARIPDVIFCFGWSKLLKKELLQLTPVGVVGYHPSALPANRGRHPLIWALVLGLKKTASTFFFMDEGADSGDILSQREVLIDDQDVAATLYEKVVETAIAQLDEFVPALAKGKNLRQQQDHAMSNTWRKRGIADGRIDWRMSAQSVHNLVRGLSRPYVGAHFDYGDGTVKVWQAVPVKECSQNHEPGKIFALRDGKPVIKCGEDAIFLIETDPPFFVPVGTYL